MAASGAALAPQAPAAFGAAAEPGFGPQPSVGNALLSSKDGALGSTLGGDLVAAADLALAFAALGSVLASIFAVAPLEDLCGNEFGKVCF